jgi:hypothetical protein
MDSKFPISANCARAKTLELLELLGPSWGPPGALLAVLAGTWQEPGRNQAGDTHTRVPDRALSGADRTVSAVGSPPGAEQHLTGGHTLFLML